MGNCPNCGNTIMYGGPPCCDGGKAKRERAILVEKEKEEELLRRVDEKLKKIEENIATPDQLEQLKDSLTKSVEVAISIVEDLNFLTQRVGKVEQKLYVVGSALTSQIESKPIPKDPVRCSHMKGDLQCLNEEHASGGHVYPGAATCPEHIVAIRDIGAELTQKRFRELVEEGQRLRRTFDAKVV